MSDDKKKIVINCVEDILAALDSNDLSIIAAVLRAISLNPKKALSYKSEDGRDLTTELNKRFCSSVGNVLKTGYFAAMVAIDAPEYLEAYKTGFYMNQCPEIMLAAASKLAERPVEQVKDFLVNALFNDSMPKQSQLAANILSSFEGLGKRELVRVVLLANKEDSTLPPLNEETLDVWLVELSGPLQEEAMMVLEHDVGESGYRLLKTRWFSLENPIRVWVIDWGARKHPVHVLDLLADALNSGNEDLQLASLRGLEGIPEFAKLMVSRISELYRAENRLMRIAALKAMPEIDAALVEKVREDDKLLLLALKKLPAKKEHENLFSDLLGDERWVIRSVATKKMLELGSTVAAFDSLSDQSCLGVGTKIAMYKIINTPKSEVRSEDDNVQTDESE